MKGLKKLTTTLWKENISFTWEWGSLDPPFHLMPIKHLCFLCLHLDFSKNSIKIVYALKAFDCISFLELSFGIKEVYLSKFTLKVPFLKQYSKNYPMSSKILIPFPPKLIDIPPNIFSLIHNLSSKRFEKTVIFHINFQRYLWEAWQISPSLFEKADISFTWEWGKLWSSISSSVIQTFLSSLSAFGFFSNSHYKK